MSAHHPRQSYEDFARTVPAAQAALRALGKAVDESGLDKALTELIKVRASQINGCAFCLQMHLGIARKLGIAAEKLDLLPVWREAGIFSARETAALAWTEALTTLGPYGAPDEVYTQVLKEFSAGEATFLTVSIGTINQWNRIAIALRFPVQPAWPTSAT